MGHGEVDLRCPACRKGYKVRDHEAGKTYSCPRCKGPLEVHVPDAGPELSFRDEPRVPREIPVRLGRYLIDGEIARGGMGVVYRGRQEGLDRAVAIKLLLGGLASDPEMVQRFHREARAAARLRHPNIVAIHEVGEYEGQPFFTMDFIPGKSLDALLREGPMDVRRGARILRDTARAVHHAHQQGILHRDLKPGNVLIDAEDRPHVTDFGLAKDLDSKSMLSVTGEVMGTPAFMSPEQAEGRVHQLDCRSDIYSLGAMLYRILTGRPPFEGPTMAATIYKVVHEYTTDPEKLNPRVPSELSAVCMKSLEKDPKDRYATAGEFAEEMDRFLKGEPVAARPLSGWQRLRRQAKRNRRVLWAAGSVGAAALVALAAILILVRKNELDLIEENLARPEMRFVAMKALLEGLERFDDRSRALALARGAVTEGTDEASRGLAYAKPVPELAEAYAAHLPLEDPERLRIALIRILASLQHRPAVPEVLDILRVSRGSVRLEAVRFFKSVPDARAFYALGTLVADRECGAEARIAIQRLYIDKVLAIYHPSAAKTGGALADLGMAVEEHNRRLEEVLGAGGRKGPKDAVEAAISELRSGDPARRMKAAWDLGELKDARGRDPLLAAVEDPDDGVSRMAAAALVHLDAAVLKDRIVELLGHDRPGVRRNAAFLLGKIGDKSARPALEAAHREESDPEAKYAMEDALVLLR